MSRNLHSADPILWLLRKWVGWGGGERGCRLWRDANRFPVDDGGSTSFKVVG